MAGTSHSHPNTSPYLASAFANGCAHVFHSWSAQAALNATVIAGALGSRMWDDKGNTWLDFSSQLVNVNIGPQHPKLVATIQAHAARLCTKHGMVMICDEVMAGFGRCGEWFAVDRWNVTPDLITFARGSNSGYLPVGGVIISRAIAESWQNKVFPGGLTYSGHPLAAASVVASIGIFKEEKIVENARSADAKPMVELMGAGKAGGAWPFAHFSRLQVTPHLNARGARPPKWPRPANGWR